MDRKNAPCISWYFLLRIQRSIIHYGFRTFFFYTLGMLPFNLLIEGTDKMIHEYVIKIY